MSRRHDSLIPLSHQHQHALAIAVIIRRRIGIEKGESPWREEMAEKVRQLHAAELSCHFEAEETILFPAMERSLGPLELVTELRREHQALRDLVGKIAAPPAVPLQALDEFSALLERHVRKEERELFPEFEKRMPPEEALKLGRELDTRLARTCSRL